MTFGWHSTSIALIHAVQSAIAKREVIIRAKVCFLVSVSVLLVSTMGRADFKYTQSTQITGGAAAPGSRCSIVSSGLNWKALPFSTR